MALSFIKAAKTFITLNTEVIFYAPAHSSFFYAAAQSSYLDTAKTLH